MDFKACRKCGKEVKLEAVKCPHCGVSGPAISDKQTALGCLVFLVVAYLLGSWLVGLGGPQKPELLGSDGFTPTVFAERYNEAIEANGGSPRHVLANARNGVDSCFAEWKYGEWFRVIAYCNEDGVVERVSYLASNTDNQTAADMIVATSMLAIVFLSFDADEARNEFVFDLLSVLNTRQSVEKLRDGYRFKSYISDFGVHLDVAPES